MTILTNNECLFLLHSLMITCFTLFALWFSKEALITIIVTHCILANLFVTKQITLFSLSATGTDAFIIGSVIGLNVLQEYFGSQIARRVILANLFILFYFALCSLIHCAYIANEFDTMSHAFYIILSPLVQIIFVSMAVFLFVQFFDYTLFQWLKDVFGERFFVARNFFSVAFCQLLDTALFTFFGLSGLIHNIWHVALMSYSIKLLSIFIISPLLFSFHRFFQKKLPNRNIEKII